MSKINKIIILALFIIIVLFLVIYYNNTAIREIINIFSSEDKLEELILKYNGYSTIIFFLLQILQVIISPIPGNVTTFIGGSLFGPLKGSLLSCFAILTGSVLAYYLAKIYGKPLVIKLTGSERYNKYSGLFQKRFLTGLFLLFLFPFFPDDLLCFLAGLSAIPLPLFLILLIGRLPGIIFGALLGSGIVELSIGWWLFIAAIFLPVFILILYYHNQIENYLLKRLKKSSFEKEGDRHI